MSTTTPSRRPRVEEDIPPVSIDRDGPDPMSTKARIAYAVIALLGALGWVMIAFIKTGISQLPP